MINLHDFTNRRTFLGRYDYEGESFDLYYHAEGVPDVLARWGEDVPYATPRVLCSNSYERTPLDHPITEALRRAQEMGLEIA